MFDQNLSFLANEELARYSPSSTPRTLSPVAGITTGQSQSLPEKPIMMKSMSDVTCSSATNTGEGMSLAKKLALLLFVFSPAYNYGDSGRSGAAEL